MNRHRDQYSERFPNHTQSISLLWKYFHLRKASPADPNSTGEAGAEWEFIQRGGEERGSSRNKTKQQKKLCAAACHTKTRPETMMKIMICKKYRIKNQFSVESFSTPAPAHKIHFYSGLFIERSEGAGCLRRKKKGWILSLMVFHFSSPFPWSVSHSFLCTAYDIVLVYNALWLGWKLIYCHEFN